MSDLVQKNNNKVQKYVENARKEVKIWQRREKDVNTSRNKIADYANKAEDLGYKITKFAKEIGLVYSTLKGWCSKRKKETQMKAAVKELEQALETPVADVVLDRVLNKLDSSTTQIETIKAITKEIDRKREDIVLDRALPHLDRLKFNICDGWNLATLDRSSLELAQSHINAISKKLDTFLGMEVKENSTAITIQ